MKGRTTQTDYQELSDSQLLNAFTEVRDERAFGELVSRHGPVVMSVCRRRLRNEHNCQDAFQATFLTLVTKANWIREKSSVAGWLQRVAVAISINLHRSNLRQPVEADIDDVTSERNVDIEQTLMIEEELARLPANYRNAIVLCHLEGHKSTDAAEILGVPRNTLKSWLVRGREMMRKRLVKQGVSLSIGGLISSFVSLGGTSAVEASLIQETSRAASLYASGQMASTASAASLAKATTTKMLLTKISTLTALIVLPLCFLSVGVFEGQKALMAATIISDNFEGSFDGSWEVIHGEGSVEVRDGKLVITGGSDRNATVIRPLTSAGEPIRFEDVSISGLVTEARGAQSGFVVRLDPDLPGSPPNQFSVENGAPRGYYVDFTGGVFEAANQRLSANIATRETDIPEWISDTGGLLFDAIQSEAAEDGGFRSRVNVEGGLLTPEIYPPTDPTDVLRWSAPADSIGQGEVGLWMVTRGANPVVEIDDIVISSVVPEPEAGPAILALLLLGTVFSRSFKLASYPERIRRRIV